MKQEPAVWSDLYRSRFASFSHAVLALTAFLLSVAGWRGQVLTERHVSEALLVGAGTWWVYQLASRKNWGSVFGAGLCLLLAPFVSLPTLFYLAALGLPALLYAPIRLGKQLLFKGLRPIPYFKTFHISATWSLATSHLLIFNLSVSADEKAGIVLGRFLLVFAISLAFDQRDKEIDQATGLQTLALKMGRNGTLALGFTSAILAAGIYQIFRPGPHSLMAPGLLVLLLLQPESTWNHKAFPFALDASLLFLAISQLW
jgi:hypothetical protein